MTRSRLLISLMVIALVAALIGGATMAWFTDDDDAEPVTMTAGTLLIDLDSNFEDVIGANVENLNPGDEFSWEIAIENVGTKNFKWLFYVCWEDIIGQLNESLGEEMMALLVDKGYGDAGLSEVLEFVITDKETGDAVFAGTLPAEGPIGAEMDTLAPGAKAEYVVTATLPGGTGNEYQGAKLGLAYGVKAWQSTNDAPGFTLEDVECPFDASGSTPPAPPADVDGVLSGSGSQTIYVNSGSGSFNFPNAKVNGANIDGVLLDGTFKIEFYIVEAVIPAGSSVASDVRNVDFVDGGANLGGHLNFSYNGSGGFYVNTATDICMKWVE